MSWERIGWWVLAALLLGSSPLVLYRTTRVPGSDFPAFYDSGRYVLEHRARAPDTKFRYYLPSVDAAFALLAWMPLPAAATVWYLLGCGAWLCLLATTGRYVLAGSDHPQPSHAVLAAGLLMMPLVLDHLCIGAFHVIMVWLMVAGLGRASQGRTWSGGILLGLAVWIKLLPALGVGYLVLKRRWLPAVVAVVTVLLVDLVLSLAAFGPQTAWELHREWYQGEAVDRSDRMLTHAGQLDEDRLTNQSVMIIMRRLLTQMGRGASPGRDQVAFGHLTPGQLRVAYYAVMLSLGAGVGFFCRRPWHVLSPPQWSAEIALIVLSTLWFSPLVWSYHPTAATPALALVLSHGPRRLRLAWTITALWLLSIALLAWPAARAFGVLLWMNLLLGGALVWTSWKGAGHGPQPGECRHARQTGHRDGHLATARQHEPCRQV